MTTEMLPAAERAAASSPRSWLRRLWEGLLAVLGAVLGLLPHVLHHVGFLAGTALVAGSGGTALFGVLGYLASIPLLVKLYRRFGSWRAPVIGIAVFTAMFALSAFVIGPAVSGSTDGDVAPAQEVAELDEHHPD